MNEINGIKPYYSFINNGETIARFWKKDHNYLPIEREFTQTHLEQKKDFRVHIRNLQLVEVIRTFSYCKRNQVGALIYKKGQILSEGYNGTIKGFPNVCEDEDNNTHWHVIHAEQNAITKLAKYGGSSDESTLYISISPCKECTKLIIQSGIKTVVVSDLYRDTTGLEVLLNAGLEFIYIPIKTILPNINLYNK